MRKKFQKMWLFLELSLLMLQKGNFSIEGKLVGIKNAIIYGLSIIVIYIVIGLAVSAIFVPDVLKTLPTGSWFNFNLFYDLFFRRI